MARSCKALERVRNNPNNATAKDLMKSLGYYGFKLRNVSGSHYHYKRNGFRVMTVPYCQNPVALRIVKEILKVIDEVDEQSNDN
jgi:predicted RNA binding protein YcfA (HicA-like mRNA interferase family)